MIFSFAPAPSVGPAPECHTRPSSVREIAVQVLAGAAGTGPVEPGNPAQRFLAGLLDGRR
jgi:hypothetical protein